MNYIFCAKTDPGRVRQNNEDSVAFDVAAQLGVLADGIGGYKAGEVASSMATAFIKSEFARWLSQAGRLASSKEIRRAIELCVANANHSIFKAAMTNTQYSGMGTTLVVAVFQGTRLVLGHIGDSRCYRWRSKALLQITKDHSVLQEQMDAGLLTPEQAALSPKKNLITRAMGVQDTALLELKEYEVEEGDIYLMCSDGLTDMVKNEAIAEILQNGASLAQMVDELVTLANHNGGRDNITILLAQAAPIPDKHRFVSRLFGR